MGRKAGASGSESSPGVPGGGGGWWERGCASLVLERDVRGWRRAGVKLSTGLAESSLFMSSLMLGAIVFRPVSTHVVLM